jgi:hypothetical protein
MTLVSKLLIIFHRSFLIRFGWLQGWTLNEIPSTPARPDLARVPRRTLLAGAQLDAAAALAPAPANLYYYFIY